jgi:hypothetical protein
MKPKQSLLNRIDLKLLGAILLFLSLQLESRSQGTFLFWNLGQPTRLGTLGGPVAGPGIWGQALVGLTMDSLTPLGSSLEHGPDGRVAPEGLEVPFADAGTRVLVQMAAWDGRVWGTAFSGVPPNQLGFTDIVPVALVPFFGLQEYPHFTSPAVVPEVPEPSATALALLGGAALLVHLCRRRPLVLIGSAGESRPFNKITEN